MNEVSIIINGVRYDAVETTELPSCDYCDLRDYCFEIDKVAYGGLSDVCAIELGDNKHFKKSDKKFER